MRGNLASGPADFAGQTIAPVGGEPPDHAWFGQLALTETRRRQPSSPVTARLIPFSMRIFTENRPETERHVGQLETGELLRPVRRVDLLRDSVTP